MPAACSRSGIVEFQGKTSSVQQAKADVPVAVGSRRNTAFGGGLRHLTWHRAGAVAASCKSSRSLKNSQTASYYTMLTEALYLVSTVQKLPEPFNLAETLAFLGLLTGILGAHGGAASRSKLQQH